MLWRLFTLFPLIISLILGCKSKQENRNAWIIPLEDKVDLRSLQRNNYEIINLQANTKGLTPLLTLDNTQRGDERTNWQTTLHYNPEGSSNFSGELILTYWEIPFHNQMALSLRLTADLWDQEHKRSREYLPIACSQAYLYSYQNSLARKQDLDTQNEEPSQPDYQFPMIWNKNPDALYYEAILTPQELNKLMSEVKMHDQLSFHLSIGERNYEIRDLDKHLKANLQEITHNINARLNPDKNNLLKFSLNNNSKKTFSSPWIALGKQYLKIQAQFSPIPNSSTCLTLIIGSYNSSLIRNAYMGNASLIFTDQEKVYFIPFEKLSYFSSLQHKQTPLLSFATISSNQQDFFEKNNWKGLPKEFWQFNMISQNLSEEELSIIKNMIDSPTAKLTLSLSEDLLFSGDTSLKYLQNLLKAIYTAKKLSD